jgi:hypothetical protein
MPDSAGSVPFYYDRRGNRLEGWATTIPPQGGHLLWLRGPADEVPVDWVLSVVFPNRARSVGFQNSATSPDLSFYAARSYSLMRPPRTVDA